MAAGEGFESVRAKDEARPGQTRGFDEGGGATERSEAKRGAPSGLEGKGRGEPARAIVEVIDQLHRAIAGALKGKPEVIRLALTTLLARGHLLVEDVPGVGKTTLASALARAVSGRFVRIQFTSDMLPSDLV